MKFKKRKMIIVLIIILIIIITAGIFIYHLFNRSTSSPVLKSADRSEKWRADLQFVKRELPKKHKNLFFSKSKTEFDRDMDLLIGRVGKYNDMQMKGQLAKIVSSINDSHTAVDIYGDSAYPIKFFQFEDGIYVVDAPLKYEDLWGKKLTGINGYSIEQLHSKIDSFISRDNNAILKNQFCNLIRSNEVLKISGITEGNNVVVNFSGDQNNNVKVGPLKGSDYENIKFLSNDSKYVSKSPFTKQKMDKNYWFKYIEDSKIAYVKYNSCQNMKGYLFSKFTEDTFKIIDNKKASILVVDLRDNGGGNSKIFNTFLDELKKRSNINSKGHLFVIIGRKTFSSAILNAMDLKNNTNAILVGEPTGGKPNHFGEVKMLHLSNVNVDIQYSSNYFKTSDKNLDSIYPDVNIKLKSSSYFNGRDDFMDYIKSTI
ncbi:S41 family peptidase [Clostridium sp. WLY-B-L2]|uniref:S41 family peptidase n=1 Tax=Clostridium aromativorans TaxID=2836848 RepID=A0ABS8N8L4_9CLOT|nr:S41 family peptidase [Clostridium aromativorans]MCC9296153.1 S41 family peptidase [Clostridium aromativorans]